MFAASKTASASTGGVSYIEDVFSTYLYTGNGSTQTITNGIDLSTKGGLVWTKWRSGVTYVTRSHQLFDSARGLPNALKTDTTGAQVNTTGSLTTFNTDGFSFGGGNSGLVNWSGENYASWTFRKQPKFFDVVTYTGTGANTTIAHSLGSVPACIMVKRTDTTGDWQVYHSSLANTQYMVLNTTAAVATGATRWNSTTPTSTVFSLGTDATVNASAGTYVAYVFANNAGGFGLTGTDNVISCGSFTSISNVDTAVSLGYEPQFLLMKASSTTGNWTIIDSLRGIPTGTMGGADDSTVSANLANAENLQGVANLTSTGFQVNYGGANQTYIYIAIRRGPMKVPTDATKVFGLSARSGTGANATVTGGQTDDAVLIKNRGSAVASLFSSRLTSTGYLVTSATDAEVAAGTTILQANPWDVMDGVKVGTTSTITNASGSTFVNYLFKRAPSFMDVVCYTGTGANTTITHNLGVVPEMMIVKQRDGINNWDVYVSALGNTKVLNLEGTAGSYTSATTWNSTTPTSSVFSLGTSGEVNASGGNFVAYLFATCAGVSKVGTYTGNGTTQTIDCGLTAGARFVLIKKTSATGDWYIYDTARGMTTLTDPYWLANSSAAEAATLGSVTTVATGFAVNSAILAAINTNAATYIFLAIA